jgi:hypothetical protein
MKLILLVLLSLTAVAQYSYAGSIKVIVPTLETGALHNYWWMEDAAKREAFQTTGLNSQMLKRGLDLLARPTDEKLWSKFEDKKVLYFFFTNIEKPITERFLIQRVKKIVRFFKDGSTAPYKETTTYLVEAFKTWTGYPKVEGTIKRADGHDAIFSSIGKKRTKVVYKEFETGVGTIEGLAEDSTVWPFEARSLYFGTKYDDKGKALFNKVKFTDSMTWTLNVEVRRDGYLIESPELGLSKSLRQ